METLQVDEKEVWRLKAIETLKWIQKAAWELERGYPEHHYPWLYFANIRIGAKWLREQLETGKRQFDEGVRVKVKKLLDELGAALEPEFWKNV